MAVELVLPKLGMTMESARIAQWIKNDGERVEQDEVVLTIETDKVLYEVAAPAAGILLSLVRPEEEVPVGVTVAMIAANEAEYEALRAGKEMAPAQVCQALPVRIENPTEEKSGSGEPADKIRIAPAARRLAQEKGIDIHLIRGTGPEGRITREDVIDFEKQMAAIATPAKEETAAGHALAARGEEDRIIVLKRTEQRRIVAHKMTQAIREAAQTIHSQDMDATELNQYRKQILVYSEKEAGVRVTITDVLMKLTACSLKQHLIMNSTYTDDADIVYRDIHMGMAMSIRKHELLVPVIRNIDKKPIIDIARTRSDYVDRARRGRLLPDEIKGSTFTFSALGMFGLERFVAIINRPENAILAAGAILERPWVHNGQVAIRKIINLTLTYDHRTIYGADAARFMATLKSLIENPESVLDREGRERQANKGGKIED